MTLRISDKQVKTCSPGNIVIAPSAWSRPGAIKDRVTIESIFRYIFIYFVIILGISYGMGTVYQLWFICNNRPKIITSSCFQCVRLAILCVRA